MTTTITKNYSIFELKHIGFEIQGKTSYEILHKLNEFNEDIERLAKDLKNLEDGKISEPTHIMAINFGMQCEKFNHPYEGILVKYYGEVFIETSVGKWRAFPSSKNFGNEILFEKL